MFKIDVWISDKMYNLFPVVCFCLANVAIFLPSTVVKWLCVCYLYGYVSFVWYKRYI
jgi:hypothetical protein